MKAIIAALPREVSGLVRGVRPEPEARRAGVFLYRLPGCLVVCAGMGTVRATLAVEAAMRSHEIDELLSVGLAGGCHPKVAVGSVVEAGTVIDAVSGERFSGAAGASGVLVTTHTIASITEKIRLFASYRADVVDMEAATVARLATMHGIGFRAFKAVSDGHDFELSSLSRFASAHGHFRTGAFALHTALRPHHWRKTMRLGSASQRALSALTAVLRDEVLKGL